MIIPTILILLASIMFLYFKKQKNVEPAKKNDACPTLHVYYGS